MYQNGSYYTNRYNKDERDEFIEGGYFKNKAERAFQKYRDTTPRKVKYSRIANSIYSRAKDSRRFVFYRPSEMVKYVTYWAVGSKLAPAVPKIFDVIKRLLKELKSGKRTIQEYFPMSVVSPKNKPSTMVESMIMLASLGFMMTGSPVRIIMPGVSGLRYLEALFEVAMTTQIPMLKKKMGGIFSVSNPSMTPQDMQNLTIYKNKCYFVGICSLKLFMPVIWNFFHSDDKEANNAELVPQDAPGWFMDLLYGIDFGRQVVSTKQALEFSTEVLSSKYAEEIRVLTDGLERKTEEAKQASRALKDAQTEIETLNRRLNEMQKKLLQQVAPVAPAAPPAPKVSSFMVNQMKRDAERTKEVQEQLEQMAYVLDNSPSSVQIEMNAANTGKNALLEQIRNPSIALKRVPDLERGSRRREQSSVIDKDKKDITNALVDALNKRKKSIQVTEPETESLAADWSFSQHKNTQSRLSHLESYEQRWYDSLLNTDTSPSIPKDFQDVFFQ